MALKLVQIMETGNVCSSWDKIGLSSAKWVIESVLIRGKKWCHIGGN